MSDWQKPDDYFNQWEMFCYAGAGVDTKATITDWANSTTTATFKPAVTLTAADSVELHRRFKVSEYNDYINMVIEMVAKEVLQYHIDHTSQLTAGVYEYPLPTEFLYLTNVYESTEEFLWHLQLDNTNVVTKEEADDLPSLWAGCHELKDDHNAHIVSTTFHSAADATNTITAADPTNLATSITFLTEYKTDFNLHLTQSGVHLNNDGDNTLSVATPTDQDTAEASFNEAREHYNTHVAGQTYAFEEIDPRYYHIVKAGTVRIVFDHSTFPLVDGRMLRMEGLASPAALTTDASVCPINPTFVAYQTAVLLHSARIRDTSADSENHRIQADRLQGLANQERARIRTRVPAGARAVVEAT